MKKIKNLIITIISFSGCSNILLPYQEKPSCSSGKHNGYCGSVSDVFRETKDKYK